MERKIGEIFKYNGEWYQCVNTGFSCADCDIKGDCSDISIGPCSPRLRKDGKRVKFKKLKKVGEPFSCNYYGDARLVMMQEYQLFSVNVIYSYSMPIMFFTNYTHNRIAIEIKQNKEDMKKKNNGNTPLNVITDKYVNGDICYDDFEKEVKALYLCKEESKPKLKPFDLEAAKAGKSICTRNGRKARIICFDAKGIQPIVALITCDNEEKSVRYKNSGVFRFDGLPDEADLMILTEKKEGWVNVYKDDDSYTTSEEIYESKEEAIKHNPYEEAYLTTVKIEWEE